jgi:quercetin dioxygenase-like cupin family protein
VRSGARGQISSSWSKAQIAALSPAHGDQPIEAVLITLRAGGRSGKRPGPHSMAQFAFVLRGTVRLRVDDTAYMLKAGDAATILPQQDRLWQNDGAGLARILVVSVRTAR